jgi:predicted  nucleic acid-binding Zn-ribbon protein
MSVPGFILRELHRLRKHIKDLEAKMEQGPRAQRAHQSKIAVAEENLKKTQEATRHLKVQIHDKETSIKGSQHNIAKLEKTEISNKKEYDALRAEIAQANQHIRALEDEVLDLMADLEEKTKQLPELEKGVQKAKADADQFAKDHESRLGRFAEDRLAALAKLEEVEKTLPEDLLPNYQRLVAARGEDALSPVEGRTCIACYTEITAQMANELNQGMFVYCKNCGRMLYMAQ